MKDIVDHPKHYTSSPAKCSKCGERIECIDVVEHLGFNIGNAAKYLWRADHKGNPLEDLQKAAWYIAREIDKRMRAEPRTNKACANPTHGPHCCQEEMQPEPAQATVT